MWLVFICLFVCFNFTCSSSSQQDSFKLLKTSLFGSNAIKGVPQPIPRESVSTRSEKLRENNSEQIKLGFFLFSFFFTPELLLFVAQTNSLSHTHSPLSWGKGK